MRTVTELALQDWASAATENQLAAGPTLADLHGVEAVLADVNEVCRGPQLPYLIRAVAHSIDALPDQQVDALLAAIRGGVQHPDSGWVLSDALDVLCESPAVLDRLADSTARTLYAHADAALHADVAAEFAQPALLGLLRMAIGKRANPHRLLALLTEITGDEPAQALDRLPLLIGLAHDHFGDGALSDVLARLANSPHVSPPTRSDATVELALADLHDALGECDRAAVETHLHRALMRFRAVDRENEARHDARAYAAAIDAVLAFGDLADHPDTGATRARLRAATDQLEVSLITLNAWNSRHHDLPWLTARGQALGAWAHLVSALRIAETHLAQPSWYDAAGALNQLLDIYITTRAVRVLPSDSAGVGSLVFPAVESAFLRNEGLAHHLEQALTHDPQFTSNPDAIALRDAIHARHPTAASPSGVVPGKALVGRPALEALFTDKTAALYDGVSPEFLDAVETLLQRDRLGYAPTGNSRFDDKLASLLAVLAESPEWRPPVSNDVTVLLTQVLRFLYTRFDAQADLYGPRTAYLGLRQPRADGTPHLWPEKVVQDDLHDQLNVSLTPDAVERELIDVGSGRTDISYTPRPGYRYVIEIKRREPKATVEAVERNYLAQATNYTATGPPFTFLIVADHGPHTAGYTSFDDSVWIKRITRSQTETPRLVIIGVLPIGRPTPSALHIPT